MSKRLASFDGPLLATPTSSSPGTTHITSKSTCHASIGIHWQGLESKIQNAAPLSRVQVAAFDANSTWDDVVLIDSLKAMRTLLVHHSRTEFQSVCFISRPLAVGDHGILQQCTCHGSRQYYVAAWAGQS
jgi:hypothetical protein